MVVGALGLPSVFWNDATLYWLCLKSDSAEAKRNVSIFIKYVKLNVRVPKKKHQERRQFKPSSRIDFQLAGVALDLV